MSRFVMQRRRRPGRVRLGGDRVALPPGEHGREVARRDGRHARARRGPRLPPPRRPGGDDHRQARHDHAVPGARVGDARARATRSTSTRASCTRPTTTVTRRPTFRSSSVPRSATTGTASSTSRETSRGRRSGDRDGAPGHPLHRPVGRPAARGARREVRPRSASTGSSSPAGATTSRSTGRSPTTATPVGSRELLDRHGLGVWALGAHLVGQAVCDRIDERHRAILPPEVWGDGDPEGVPRPRRRAAGGHRARGRQARRHAGERVHRLVDLAPDLLVPAERLRRDRARLRGVRRAVRADHRRVRRRRSALRARGAPDRDRLRLRDDPRRTLDAIGNRPAFGINLDPSHFAHQFLDAAQFALEFADRIYHVHVKDSKRRLDGRRSILGSHLNFGEEARGWDFVSPGHGDVDFEELFRALNRIGYQGPLSIEWEDSGMDRDWGAAGRARVRPPHRLRPVGRSPSTPRCRRPGS